jgi:hypothetical protein
MCCFDKVIPEHCLKDSKKCKICYELFNMERYWRSHPCCLNECNEHEFCKKCDGGINSKQYNILANKLKGDD